MPRIPPPSSTNTIFYVYGPSAAQLSHPSSSERCSICLAFEQDFVRPDTFLPPGNEEQSFTYYMHHKNWPSLKLSARNGCQVCKLLCNGYLHTHHERRSNEHEKNSIHDTDQQLLGSFGNESPGNFVVYVPYDSAELFGPFRIFFCHTTMFEESTLEAVSRHDSWAMAEFAVAGSPDDYFFKSHGRSFCLGRVCTPDADLSLAASWLQSCQETHDCHSIWSSPGSTKLQNPTRLLLIELKKGTITLADTSTTEKYDYVALSHRWGQSKPAVTLTSNLHDRMQGFLITTLPKTFQDAILATCQLGYNFIWIDSLCIIQDDKADWERECPRMAHVYRGAVLTIAGPAAADSNAGFLHTREFVTSDKYTPCTLQNLDGKRHKNGKLTLWYPGCHREPTAKTDVRTRRLSVLDSQPDSFLQNRGWIMQEYLLSCRVLYFGSYQLYFECGRASWFESSFEPRNASRYSNNDLPLKKALEDHIGKFDILLEDWHDFITRYSACALTNAADRLPAISSIAQSLDPLDQQSYYAGIWGAHLPDSLLWFVPSYNGGRPPMQLSSKSAGTATYIAPSWSWASTQEHVRFLTLQRRQSCPIRVLSCSTDLSETSPIPDRFGRINAGRIRIEGRLCRVLMVPGTKEMSFLAWGWPSRNHLGCEKQLPAEAAGQPHALSIGKGSVKSAHQTTIPPKDNSSPKVKLSGSGRFYPDDALYRAHIPRNECVFGKFNSTLEISNAGQIAMNKLPARETFALEAVVGSGYTYHTLVLEAVPCMVNTFRRVGCISFDMYALSYINWFEGQAVQAVEVL